MARRPLTLAPLLLVAFAGTSLVAPASARAAEATIAAAEKAYAEVDFEKTYELARTALERGGNEPAETKRLYALLGIAAAALEREDEAREAFRRVLALDPSTRLDQSLSPKMRGPYLEARGALAAGGELRALEAALTRDGGTFSIELRDAAGIARTLELELVPTDGRPKRTLRFEPRQATTLGEDAPMPAAFHYVLSVRDEHENRIYRVTGRVAESVAQPPASESVAPVERPRAGDPGRPNRSPYLVTAGVLAALGVGAVTGGVVMQLRREDAAEEWNSSSCEVPGQSRGEQCADVDERRQSAQTWAIGLYATGGALLLGSVVTLALTPGSRSRTVGQSAPLPCTASFGAGHLAGSCRLRF